jgi:hypothetical protein
LKQNASTGDEDLARPGRHELSWFSEKQGTAQCLLDFADLLGESRLRDAEDRGGAPEMQVLAEYDYRAHLIQTQIHNLKLSE